MTRKTHGNDTNIGIEGGSPPMTVDLSAEMAWSLSPALPRTFPSRPPLASHQSNSLPSTPYQHPRDRSYPSRSPSPSRRSSDNGSPRSTHSESNRSLPGLRKPSGRCKYEAGMTQAKRRVPYSLGPEKLEPEEAPLKAHLDSVEDEKLCADMRELFDRLIPSPESELRRQKLVQKLERLLNERWPSYSIKVNVFGSTGNKLGTTDSDVDICITTDCQELEHVCSLAELLASHGMKRVVCVSSAKVPIVKIWDPELELSCDMNVNNPIALENTEMIREYVGIDDRVRPLAMIIKYWAKRRILNDAALGSTLSSYTWICMIINFLQTRDPPILPSLQQQKHLKPRVMNGVDVAFDKNASAYVGFGKKNDESLAELLLQFYRYYGYEVDFETSVLSVRMGKVITKTEKGWHRLQDNRLCVEEPFNTTRNLGNTADDTSFRGIHLEIRRAFRMIEEGNLDKCCEEYKHPLEEGKTFQKFVPPSPRPIVAQAPPQSIRGGRGSGRGGRSSNHFNRGLNNAGRRASSASNRGPPYARILPFQMTSQDLQLQAQHQQYLLHDHLFQQYQYLQAQEQELRMQLHQQALVQGRVAASLNYPHIAFPSYVSPEPNHDETTRTRAGTVSHPLTAPVRQHTFSYTTPYLSVAQSTANTTNPPSPMLHSVSPDLRRNPRRSSLNSASTGGSLRAHSQPARPIPSPLSLHSVVTDRSDLQDVMEQGLLQSRKAAASPSRPAHNGMAGYFSGHSPAMQRPSSEIERRTSEYIGYYVGHSPPLQGHPGNTLISPASVQTGLAIQNGGLSPRFFSRMPSYPSAMLSSSSDPLQTPRTEIAPEATRSIHSLPDPSPGQIQRPTVKSMSGPLIVNGSVPSYERQPENGPDVNDPSTAFTFSASTSEDLACDTPTSSDDSSQGLPESAAIESDFVSMHTRPFANDNNSALQDETIELGQKYRFSSGDSGSSELPTSSKSTNQTSYEENDTHAELGSVKGVDRPKTVSNLDPASTPTPAVAKGQLAQIQTGPQLSPVMEIPTPSPTNERKVIAAEHTNVNGIGNRPKSKAKQDKSSVTENESQNPRAETLVAKPNGNAVGPATRNVPNNAAALTGWQMQKKKKHKKGSKSEADVTLTHVVEGDFLPVNESMRKGG